MEPKVSSILYSPLIATTTLPTHSSFKLQSNFERENLSQGCVLDSNSHHLAVIYLSNQLPSESLHLPIPSRKLNLNLHPHLLHRVWDCTPFAYILEGVLRKWILFHLFDFPHKVVYFPEKKIERGVSNQSRKHPFLNWAF